MLFLTVILGTSTVFLTILLLAALSDLNEWKRRWNKSIDEKYELLEDYLEGCGELRRLESKLKELESKPVNPTDTNTYRVGIEQGIGIIEKEINGVHAIDEKEEGITLEDKDGKILAIIPGDFRYIIKEENE